MKKTMTFHRKKIWMVFLVCALMLLGLVGRLVYLMGVRSDYYYQKAEELHERERVIKAARGQILDAKGRILADNKTVCTISVIHSQIKEPQKVIEVLSKELEIDTDTVRKKVEKISSIERIKTNVEKSVGDVIRGYELDGVKVDEDYKRYYPYGDLASKVLGFTGGDNQGIIGLEVKYENYLKGVNGMILTTTDARGIELADTLEDRVEPVSGDTLQVSLDYNIQEYAQQAAEKVMEEKGKKLKYLVGTMIEIPRAALTADQIATEAEFFSFGTNDLTQMTFGFSRDDAGKFLDAYYDAKIFENDPFAKLDQTGVGKLMDMAIALGKPVNPNLHVGICGEHGGDPSSVEFCNKLGLDYVSCSPFRVPIARLAAAQAAIAEKNA